MNFFEKSEKLKRLRKIANDVKARSRLLEKIKEKSHIIKKVIAISALIAILMNPTVGRANAPIEFGDERLSNYNLQEIMEIIDSQRINVAPDDWANNIAECYYIVDGIRQPVYRIDIHNYMEAIFPIKLLSQDGQEALIDKIKDIPSLEEIHITVDLPEEMIEKIKNSGDYKIYFSELKDIGLSNANDYVEKNGAIVIYDLTSQTREGEWANYKTTSVNRFYFDKSIEDLNENELAFLSLDTLHMCEENGKMNNQGEVCVQIPSAVELSTEEAIRLKEYIDYIQIKSKDIYAEYEAVEVYTIDEYIEVSEAIDKVVEKINPKSSEFEKAVAIYYEIGKNCLYNRAEAAKGFSRRKEVGNLYGVFVEKSSVCAGISEGYKAICSRMGLESEYISGHNNGARVGHAWNQVKINGKWIDIDLTGDLKYIQAGEVPMFFGNKYIDFDNMSVNHHSSSEERAIIKQEIVENIFKSTYEKDTNKEIEYER